MRHKEPGRSAITRRELLGYGAIGTVLGVLAWHSVGAPSQPQANALSPPEAYHQSQDGVLKLVDIRRPDEWLATGIGQGAHPLDMREAQFVENLSSLVGHDRNARIALICARGVRSARLSRRLLSAGFTDIADIPEGMLGSSAGPGWLKRGLPILPQTKESR